MAIKPYGCQCHFLRDSFFFINKYKTHKLFLIPLNPNHQILGNLLFLVICYVVVVSGIFDDTHSLRERRECVSPTRVRTLHGLFARSDVHNKYFVYTFMPNVLKHILIRLGLIKSLNRSFRKLSRVIFFLI